MISSTGILYLLALSIGVRNFLVKKGVLMQELNKSVIPIIESVYENLTDSERIVAEFFINNPDQSVDFSANNISGLLHVSEASLTRFAKKCEFSGYREFIYAYKLNITEPSDNHTQLTQNVLADYDEILNKTYSLIDEEQIKNIVQLIVNAKRVYFYGIGSSGLVAQEMKSRFMRLGLFCDAFTDTDLIKINTSLLNEESLVIALSISSDTSAIVNALEQAQKQKAKTILLTANKKTPIVKYCDEIVSIATRNNLEFGNRISPQFPLLVIIDVLYAYFSKSDFDSRKEIFSSTLTPFDEEIEENGE